MADDKGNNDDLSTTAGLELFDNAESESSYGSEIVDAVLDNDDEEMNDSDDQADTSDDQNGDIPTDNNGDQDPPDDGDEGEPEDEEPSELRQMMSGYFIEYASYVIKERAIPHLDDGLKPVQRRILHSLKEMDDGKLHKVANVVGNTMKYHPHGDSSIYDALVNIANKSYFIDRQGNFGNIYTGDPASAARYIECRLSPLAREVLFNRELTTYTDTYDSRNKEPVSLSAKVPVLLMQGSEGIAVGMSTRLLPHNFIELLEAQIAILRKQDYELLPDFLQGGTIDTSNYDKGNGKVKLRAKIDIDNEKTIVIREIPASTTTEGLIKSIEDAVGKGKLKLSAINDYTSEEVEIEIKLPRGIYADQAITSLYAYTDCEVSISCNCLVIKNGMPTIMDVNQILEHNTFKLKDDLKRELLIELGKQEDLFHLKTLTQIFIENRIYKKIEKCKTSEAIKKAVRSGLEPFLKDMLPPAAKFPKLLTDEIRVDIRDVTDEDIDKLLQIPIRRISQFDIDKNNDELNAILDKTEEILKNLNQLTRYTIRYIKDLISKYKDQYPRRTRFDEIKEINVRAIAAKNIKVGFDRGNGFIGTKVKSDEPMLCSEFDRIVIFKKDGTFKVVPIPDKLYVGPVIGIFKANKEHIFSMIYRDKKNRVCYAKRFRVSSYIMDRDYKAVPDGCRVEKLFDRYGVVLHCEFRIAPRMRDTSCELNFNEIEIRKATSRGFKVASKDIIKFIQLKRGTDPTTGMGDEDE